MEQITALFGLSFYFEIVRLFSIFIYMLRLAFDLPLKTSENGILFFTQCIR